MPKIHAIPHRRIYMACFPLTILSNKESGMNFAKPEL